MIKPSDMDVILSSDIIDNDKYQIPKSSLMFGNIFHIQNFVDYNDKVLNEKDYLYNFIKTHKDLFNYALSFVFIDAMKDLDSEYNISRHFHDAVGKIQFCPWKIDEIKWYDHYNGNYNFKTYKLTNNFADDLLYLIDNIKDDYVLNDVLLFIKAWKEYCTIK